MKTYEFSIIASGLDPEAGDFEARFYNSGCDDALVAFQRGHTIVDFAREANSIDDAIASAIENVRSAGATVEHVEPDPLVSLSEIAARTGLTRAAISHYSKGDRAKDFPAPIAKITTDSPLWDWATVARWLFVNKKITRDAVVEAVVVKSANTAIVEQQPNIRDSLQKTARDCELAL